MPLRAVTTGAGSAWPRYAPTWKPIDAPVAAGRRRRSGRTGSRGRWKTGRQGGSMNSEVEIPQAPDAELAILGGVLLEQSVPPSVRARLRPEQFFVKSSRKIYEAELALDE